jgi:hypothetical protein
MGLDAGVLLDEDAGFGACKVFVPSTSAMKGRGQGGADIGANVLFRSVDGALTSAPLWDTSTGAFPCAAQVQGLNDVPDASCFDIHLRLNVGSAACPLPYQADAGPEPDGGQPDGGQQPQLSAYGLRCSAGDGWPSAWLCAVLWLRRRLKPCS